MSSAKIRTILDGFLGINFGCSLLLINNFRFSITKKLCGPLAHRYVTKWPAIANRFVTPGLDFRAEVLKLGGVKGLQG